MLVQLLKECVANISCQNFRFENFFFNPNHGRSFSRLWIRKYLVDFHHSFNVYSDNFSGPNHGGPNSRSSY